MIVIDASALLEILIGSVHSDAIISRIERDDGVVHAPHLLDVECLQTIRRQTMAGMVEPTSAEEALIRLASFPLRRHDHAPLIDRIWALRHNLSAYDATYVALAESLGLPLLTRDGRLAGAPGLQTMVEVIE